jgi:hypothetical protein
MSASITALAEAQKRLLAGVSWSGADVDGVMQFVAPLALDGLTIGGLHLRGTCREPHPDRAVTLQVELASPGRRTRLPLARLDWRPLAEPHRNPLAHSLPNLSRLTIFGSHFHAFELNWVPSNNAMRGGNLPFAIILEKEPHSFGELLDIAKVLLRIENISRVPRPDWIERLL